MKKTHPHFLVILLSLCSCGAIIKSSINKDDSNVPPEFGRQKSTLLVLSHGNGYNSKVEKIIKKSYSGEYSFVSKQELTNKPYNDTIKYRYLLNDNISTDRTFTGSTYSVGSKAGQQTNEMTSTAARSYYITDRKTNKVFGTDISSGTSWKKILQVYLKKLDTERKKNGGV